MASTFDLLVIGTGPAGSTVATKCAKAGLRVAIVESREFGGTCALRGCNPKKVLVRAAELVDWAQRADGKLLAGGDATRIDWTKLIQFKRTFTEPIAASSEASFQEDGISTFHASAKFHSENQIELAGEIVEAEHVLIATGARPATIDVAGGDLMTTSDDFLDLETLPERICFIGGGYISFELANVAVRAGADVTIVDRNDRPLGSFDPDLVDRLVERTKAAGIRVMKQTSLESIAKEGDELRVSLSANGSGAEPLVVDMVVHGAGRVPNLQGMKLEKGGVKYESSGVLVNSSLQSISNARVYAAGDCVAKDEGALTPTANEEARAIVKSLLEKAETQPDYGPVPSVVFSIPPLSACGMTESAAKEQGKLFDIKQGDMSDWGSTRKVCENCAGYKLIIERDTRRILGAHLLGPGAAETINLFAVAMRAGMNADELNSVLIAFPTFAYDIRSMI